MTRRELLSAVREACQEAAAAGELPALLGELEKARTEALCGLTVASARSRVLTPEETATRLGRSVSWVYKNRRALPMVHFPTGGYGFDEKRLERWVEGRTR